MSEFIPLEEFLKQNHDYTRSQLMSLKCNDFVKKNMSRFKKIGNTVYTHKDFPNTYKDKALLCEELYFKVKGHFKSDYAMAQYFAPLIDEKLIILFNHFYALKFWQSERKIHKTLKLIDEFNKFLKEKE
ncbi:hypothetical protein [Campylobacter ureolyticus]|uniref:Uncharacterized protein n=1 Tax=Campylobacter ureolyticus TaxID=827 RepID=A0A9Q4PV53_9BACT|nr:hypothetical protein [Campylobacter ureolyticus]MCZ6159130.1 hypothetical protein [Campylobacter ureolyticus]MCZ6162934.1 hypothetical protein [Campylobacter ureolyticus]MCZ6164573.1 hypothetical protein [Campylobacter ureolyticus]